MPDFLLALHYLCCTSAILILRAVLYIMSCFSARKTTRPCGMMPAVGSPRPADPSRAMRTHTLPLRGDIRAWPQAEKNTAIEMCLECNVFVQFWPAVWLGGKNVFFFFLNSECPYFDLRQTLQILHSSFAFQYWFLQWIHLVSGSWPKLLFLKTPLCKDCNSCHHAFPDAAGHGHAWNKRNLIVTRGKLTCCHPP